MDLITVYKTSNIVEAKSIEAELRAHDLFVHLLDQNLASNYAHLASVIPLRIEVLAADAISAKKIIDDLLAHSQAAKSPDPSETSLWAKLVVLVLLLRPF